VAYLAVSGVAFLTVTFIAAPLLVHDGAPLALGFGSADSVGGALWYALAGVVMLPAVPYLLALLAGAHGVRQPRPGPHWRCGHALRA
jgi:hypothetical protein